MPQFVGRTDALARLGAAYQAVGTTSLPGARRLGLALVTGEAGMGKTALLARFADDLASLGVRACWGTCWDEGHAPAFWPWTQALRELLGRGQALRRDLRPELALIVPELAPRPAEPAPAADGGARLRLFDAVASLLARAARTGPVVVILDDLQWSDLSSLDLLRFLARTTTPGPVLLVGAYRPDEVADPTKAALVGLAHAATPVPLGGLAAGEVSELVADLAGAGTAAAWAAEVYRRSAGHPFFVRELTYMLASGRGGGEIPMAVREVIASRIARVSTPCARLLDAASVAGTQLLPDILAEVTGDDPVRVGQLLGEACDAGIVAGPAEELRFAHDLYRECSYASLSSQQRLDLHQRVGTALASRHARGGLVFPADVARHFAAAAAVAGPEPVLAWAQAAATADAARFAFTEAAGHLARARWAITAAGSRLPDPELISLLTAEADARQRGGDSTAARDLLLLAWQRAAANGVAAEAVGAAALGLDRLGARFAMPRTELIAALEHARRTLAGTDSTMEAEVTAALARQLQHSVARDRPRAAPLANQAVRIARRLADPATLASCLLAQHDVIWTPGTAPEREAIARELSELAEQAGDPERRAQGLLLAASAQLEAGNPAFRATLAEYTDATRRLRQPRHDYLALSRAAALALLDGDIGKAEDLVQTAYALGESVGDSDAGNVRMSQRLEIARARGDATELRQTAVEAVRWWVGAPAHAHAVAAGFLARAGDLDAARREVEIVTALPDWRADRSYLWSVFVGELATAAIALDDHPLCTELLEQLNAVGQSCAVNGALVCFMGAHAHRIGLLHAALGRTDEARRWLQRALRTHRGLGAGAWEAETRAALANLDPSPAVQRRVPAPAPPHAAHAAGDVRPRLLREGDMWLVGYRGRTAYLRDAKGLHDLAVLLARPGVDVPALELAGSRGPAEASADPVLDRAALAAYRSRLTELSDELAAAEDAHDLGRAHRASGEREQIVAELRRSARPGGSSRRLGITAAERARKAVSGRVRDAIRRIGRVLPELGAHLDRCVRTGTTCRYEPPDPSLH